VSEETPIVVHIKYGGLEQTFTGSLEEVWISINRFFSQFIPTFTIAQRLTVAVDLAELAKQLEGLVVLTPKGPEVIVNRKRLSDRDYLMLCLVSAHLGYHMGLLDFGSLTRDELQRRLGKTAKITSTRLSELIRRGWVERVDEDRFQITKIGLWRFVEERLPKIRGAKGER